MSTNEPTADRARLRQPAINGRCCDWEAALDHIAQQLTRTLAQHGPASVGFHVSAHLLDEDYYVANKLAKGFLGSANIDTPAQPAAETLARVQRRMFGTGANAGCFEDLELADLVVLVAPGRSWHETGLPQRLRDARSRRGTQLAVLDSERSAADIDADLYLPIKAGAESILFDGLLGYLADYQAIDSGFIDRHTVHFCEAVTTAWESAASAAETAARCGLSLALLERCYRLFEQHRRTVTVFAPDHASDATDNALRAALNCHLATARIGRAGAGVLTLSRAGNLGRHDVGASPSTLVGRLPIEDAAAREQVQAFWQSPPPAAVPGLRAGELLEAAAANRIRFLWLLGTDCDLDDPHLQQILARCDFVVCSGTHAGAGALDHADAVLPTTCRGEHDGTTTDAERRLWPLRSRHAAVGAAEPHWWALTRVAHRLGFCATFDFGTAADVFREHAALSRLVASLAPSVPWSFDIGPLAELSDTEYAARGALQWPISTTAPGGTQRLDVAAGVPTPTRRAHFLPTSRESFTCARYPLLLRAAPAADHLPWLSLTRTAVFEPSIILNDRDARDHALCTNDIVKVTSTWGSGLFRAHVDDAQPPGQIATPVRWAERFASHGPTARVLNPDTATSLERGTPQCVAVGIEPWVPIWRGFLLTSGVTPTCLPAYWVKAKTGTGWRFELADTAPPEQLCDELCTRLADFTCTEFQSRNAGERRYLWFDDRHLEAVLFISPWSTPLVDPQWLIDQFAHEHSAGTVLPLLAGRPADAAAQVRSG